MTISSSLNSLWEEAEAIGINLYACGLEDDEDITIFAINFLKSNLEDALDGLEIKEDE
jgi:hypothetical protein